MSKIGLKHAITATFTALMFAAAGCAANTESGDPGADNAAAQPASPAAAPALAPESVQPIGCCDGYFQCSTTRTTYTYRDGPHCGPTGSQQYKACNAACSGGTCVDSGYGAGC
ncbi:MAG TPA: hypothetical protein VNO21_02465 [Polyangiaceae bacterium]|nr:hypothetical protein [Polyangiaceae bacterium]